jgi:folylpolyglutamate synthase/dihydrofolate synthase
MPEKDSQGKPYTLYEKCVRRLYLTNLFHPVKLGLQNIERLHNALGNPMDAPNLILVHVAGTNGKGSTSLKIARTLELAGMRVGLFVSPHIASFRERMQVNQELISEQEVEQFLPMIYDICERERIPATFFEVTTALAFQFFASRKVNAVVLETGLGGRLDATNVVRNPSICVITSIGLEHTRILGDTVELIAMEKAGIIKSNAPVLVGPHCPHETIRKCAVEKQASAYYTCWDVLKDSALARNLSSTNDEEYFDYDIENAVIARAALRVMEKNGDLQDFPLSEDVIQKGTGQRPPCRFEELTVRGSTSEKLIPVILDVAHNPDAMKYLVKKIQATHPNKASKIRMVVGFSADKDLRQCGQTLLDFNSDPNRLHLVEAAHPRAAKLEDMFSAEPRLLKSNFNENNRSITMQVETALRLAEENDEMLVICGSVFLMAEAREALGINEPRDSKYIAEVAGANLRHGQELFADRDPEKTLETKSC